MGREIKFRVWDSERKQMYHLSQNRFSFGLFEGHRAVSWEDVFAEQHDELIQLQYTGLKDKNGREVFHMDVWQFHGLNYTVEWDAEYAMFYLKHPSKRATEDDNMRLFVLDQGEVIGSIFENPELLEV
ncbi:YopX family protein [Paenibacillus sp. FSL K6-1217]|uniref:YopX family protein n=1 Tax=Paenibacillus sp. FSL K6-1217 TaxID=2921466 RepID=UPI0032436739